LVKPLQYVQMVAEDKWIALIISQRWWNSSTADMLVYIYIYTGRDNLTGYFYNFGNKYLNKLIKNKQIKSL
jgi:hypothetical protein